MKSISPKKVRNSVLLFLLISPFTILFYASYVFNPDHAGNLFLYILQIIADGIAITIYGSLWITILLDLLQSETHRRDIKYKHSWLEEKKPAVDVLITTANEPFAIVLKTITAAVIMEYPHKTYVLDDGNSEQVKQLCDQLGVIYYARPQGKKRFAKSGNLNYGLQFCTGDLFAVFDADHIPEKNFLRELLPLFENEKVSLVQTPQYYTNTDNFIAAGTAQAQEVFYEYVQPAKNSYNATFCVGTNMIYRRKALEDIGGIPLMDHSEDIWTTILLHEKGYESVFYNKVLAQGRAPETIQAFFRQQNRWARGGFSLFFSHNPLFVRELTLDQRLQYFFSNFHYFSVFTILIYLILPIVYLLFNIHPMDILHGNGWLIHYVPYVLTVYFLPFILLKNFKLATISISIASFYPHLQAFIATLLQQDYTWHSTESNFVKSTPLMFHIYPHIFLILLSLLSLFVGWYNPVSVVTTGATSLWIIANIYLLLLFIKNGIRL